MGGTVSFGHANGTRVYSMQNPHTMIVLVQNENDYLLQSLFYQCRSRRGMRSSLHPNMNPYKRGELYDLFIVLVFFLFTFEV